MAILLWARIVFLMMLTTLVALFAWTAYRTRDEP
jgi:hypothetical protein